MAQSELYQRGLEQLKAGNAEEAKRLFREHEEKAGTASETPTLLRQADGRLAAGDVNGAAALYAQVLERNPSLAEVYLGLGRISLFTGQVEDARAHALAAVRLAPKLGIAWALHGLVNEASGDIEGALGDLRKAAELAPSAFMCQFNYGRALAAAGRPMEGIAYLKQATQLEPRNLDALYALGTAYQQARQFDKAQQTFEQTTQASPKNVEYWATLSDVLFEQKKFKAAREVLDKGLASCGDHPALLEKALATAMMLSDTVGAIAYVERELKVVPNHEQGWINLANLTILNGEFERSEAAARELLKRNPKSWEAWYHLGNIYEAVPREKEAEEFYRKAVSCAPDNWKPLTNLATLLIQTKDKQKHAEAVTLLEKAQKTAPKDEWRVQYNLALAHTRLNNRDKALEIARRVATQAPANDPIVDEARKLESNLKEMATRN